MKKLVTFLLLAVLSAPTFAQVQSGFSYQAVIRNSSGELLKNQPVGIQFSILKGNVNGTAVYTEEQTQTTNINGLVTAEIGIFDPAGFAAINWADGPYYLKTETDPTGGTNYSITGTSQLLNVPYAMYAAKSGDGFSGNYDDLSNKPNLSVVAATGSFTDLQDVPKLVTILKEPVVGDLLYSNGTNWELLAKGANGQTLRLDNGKPNWGEPGYGLPMVTTVAAYDVMTNAATSGGHIVATGFTEISDKGVCWGTEQNPTIANMKTNDGNGIGAYVSLIKDLLPNTTYYIRAYATNGAGTAYGNQVTFKTFQNVVFPTVTTAAVTNITANAVTSGGNITATGGGEVNARGVCWSDHQNPVVTDSKTTDGDGSGQFQSQIAGLVPSTYYARAYATNSAGIGYGNMVTFSTEKTLPVLTTKAITEISAMGAVSGGTINSSGGGTISERGICWGESPAPTIDDYKIISASILTPFSLALIKALPNRNYYVRAYAKNEIGTAYGEQKSFTTPDANSQSFETGMMPVGWSGNWVVNNERALDGSYSLRSRYEQGSDITFTVTLANPGQISFFYSFANCGTIGLYIDDVLIQTYAFNSGEWLQALNNIDAGSHIIKWHLTADYCGYAGRYIYGTGYIDNIVLPK